MTSARIEGLTIAQLQTDRLTITPFTRDLMLAALQTSPRPSISLQIARARPIPDELEVLPILAGDLDAMPDLADWGMQLVARARARARVATVGAVIGCAGMMGRPTPDVLAEVGYGIAPPYQGHGHATEQHSA